MACGQHVSAVSGEILEQQDKNVKPISDPDHAATIYHDMLKASKYCRSLKIIFLDARIDLSKYRLGDDDKLDKLLESRYLTAQIIFKQKEVAPLEVDMPQESLIEWVVANDPRNEHPCFWPNRLSEIDFLWVKNPDRELLSHSAIGKLYRAMSAYMRENIARAILTNKPSVSRGFQPKEIYTPEQTKLFQ